MPAVPPLVRRPPSQVVRTSWTFNSTDDECTAVAAAAGTSLRVSVRRDGPIRLIVTLASPSYGPSYGPSHGSPRVPLRFSGPAGVWQVAARQTAARQIEVALGSDEPALSRILVLLSGGTLAVGEPVQPIISLAIGPSDAQGQIWFDCARGKML